MLIAIFWGGGGTQWGCEAPCDPQIRSHARGVWGVWGHAPPEKLYACILISRLIFVARDDNIHVHV